MSRPYPNWFTLSFALDAAAARVAERQKAEAQLKELLAMAERAQKLADDERRLAIEARRYFLQ